MSGGALPSVPGAVEFRALASSSPWRFTTVHFTHRQQKEGRGTPGGEPVEVWLDRRIGRLTVRCADGVEVAEGVPYSEVVSLVFPGEVEAGCDVAQLRRPGPVLRADGLVAQRPEGWHYDHGDPMWRDYQFTAMLDPEELSHGVDIADVTATTLRGRLTWSATCRPLPGEGEDRENGYNPRCGCCPLLDSPASRLLEYGPEDPTLIGGTLPTVYCVHLDVQTGIVVDITGLDGTGGSGLTNAIHAVDEPLNPPT